MSKQPKAFTDIFRDEPAPQPAFKPQEKGDGDRRGTIYQVLGQHHADYGNFARAATLAEVARGLAGR